MRNKKNLLRIAVNISLTLILIVFNSMAVGAEIKEVLHLSFDGVNGQIIPDVSGSGTKAYLGKSDKTDDEDPELAVEGKFGGALQFNRTDTATVEDSPAIRFAPGESFTVEMWVKPLTGDTKERQTLVRKGTSASNWQFYLYTRGRLGFRTHSREKPEHNVNLLFSPKESLGEWHHVAFVRDCEENMLRFYYDNALVKEFEDTSSPEQFNTPAPVILGGDFYGLIDELIFTRGVKRSFNSSASPSDRTSSAPAEYQPAEPVVEKPDPEIAASWRELKEHNLSIVPAPKKFKITGNPVPIGSGWILLIRNNDIMAGIDEINSKITEYGGRAISEGNIEGGNALIVGTFEQIPEFLPMIGNPVKPERQGYVIGFYKEGGKHRVVVAGSDPDGVRYGCITLSMMIEKGPEIIPARVEDWPDYKYRMGFRIYNKNFEKAKRDIDQAFRAKMNMTYGRAEAVYNNDEQKVRESSSEWKKINQYAAERGIRIMHAGWFDVEKAPYPENMAGYTNYYYPYEPEKGLIGHRGRAFTWNRDDLITAKGRLLASFMKETGADAFYLHSMDTGGRDNPENWNYRTALDKARFGGDRVKADGNLIGRIYEELKKENPQVIFGAIVYPYSANYLKYPEVTNWMDSLSRLLPKEIFFGIRENTRENMELWKNSNSQGRFIYVEPYPCTFKLAFSSTGRFARTFYFDDRDIFWFTPTGNYDWPETWVAAEYAWNTRAPGWGWMPPDYKSIRQADSSPGEINDELLPRVTSIVFGKDAAEPMAQVFAQKLSCNLSAVLSQFSGADPEAYFKVKYEASLEAIKQIQEAAPNIAPSCRYQFDVAENFTTQARYLSEARYRYYVSRRKLAADDYAGAEEEVALAREALKSAGNDSLTGSILKDLDIAATVKRQREKKSLINQTDRIDISVGIYTLGAVKGIMDGLYGIPGMTVSRFENFTGEEINNFDVIIFSASGDVTADMEDWREITKSFVRRGKGIIFSHNAIGRYPSSAFGDTLFPEICAGYQGQIAEKRKLIVALSHPSVGDLKPGYEFEHEYYDHLCLKPGPDGKIILNDSLGNTVMVAGTEGKGRVIYTGEIFGLNEKDLAIEPAGTEMKVLLSMVRWAAGKKK